MSGKQLADAGYDVDKVLFANDLVSGSEVFVAATGVTSRRIASRSADDANGASRRTRS